MIELGEQLDTPLLSILFEAQYAYRNIDESYRFDLPQTLRTFGPLRCFYLVRQSLWLDWFHRESMNAYSGRNLTHYAIVTSADCIDVISEIPPVVTALDCFE